MILNEYSKTAWVNGASPDINKANLDNLEQGVYDVTAKAMELAAYEINAAASATAANASAVAAAAASAAVYTDLAQDVTDLTTVVANHATYSTTEEVVIGTYDGKPLYRKGISIPSLPNATTGTYPHGIQNISNITIGDMSRMTNGTNFMPIPNSSVQLETMVTIYFTTTNLVIITNNNRSSYSADVFALYTKTTD